MKKKMKFLEKKLFEGQFFEVYEHLIQEHVKFKIEDLVLLFPDANRYLLYTFIMYAISREETVEKHLAICDVLLYLEPCFLGDYDLIAWHLRQSLKISPNDVKVLQWTIDTFSSHPDLVWFLPGSYHLSVRSRTVGTHPGMSYG